MNRRDLSYKLKVNHMTDYSHEEIKRMRGYRHSKDSPRGETFVSTTKVEKIPSYYNWWLRGKYAGSDFVHTVVCIYFACYFSV